ncbi:MAG: hypothetical protein R2822_29010 [Spirosomataceae bacterium]
MQTKYFIPRGRYEKTDENLTRTALREAQESGIKAADVRVIGQLTELFIPPSNFFLYCLSSVNFLINPIFIQILVK